MRTIKKCELETFWKGGIFSSFEGLNNLDISYAQFNIQPQLPIIVISPGRTESYLKYKEVIFDLCNAGYGVFILDHRGQGLSARLLKNPHKGYVANFDDYAHDLYTFITKIVSPFATVNPPYLLAHSMGSAITLRMLQLHPTVIKKAALLSPMIGINTGLLPHYVASFIILMLESTNNFLSKESWYFLGQSNYSVKRFENNRVSHCEERYKKCIDLYSKNKTIQLGGVTIHWLYETFNTEKMIFSELDKITAPISLFQAGNDSIVSNKLQDNFCKKLHNISPKLTTKEPKIIKGAYHELLFEKDTLRSQTLSQVLHYFEEQGVDHDE